MKKQRNFKPASWQTHEKPVLPTHKTRKKWDKWEKGQKDRETPTED